MINFFSGVGVILELELRQRLRTVTWYVLIGVFVGLVALVTLAVTVATLGFGGTDRGAIYSTIIYFVLLLGTLVAPALSGNAINGDRDAGTLATTQVTLVTTWQLVLGKFFAAWITALTFLGAATPFLVYSTIVGGLGVDTILVSLGVLALELGVVAAIGVGLSGILNRPLFSIVLSYLAVAALSVGTLIAFTLSGLVVQTEVRSTYSYGTKYSPEKGIALECSAPEVTTYPAPRFDLFWGILVANPYVLLADAVPATYSSDGYPEDLFGSVKFGVRAAQIEPDTDVVFDECNGDAWEDQPTPQEIVESTTPGWFVGLIIHLVLAVAALVGAWARTRTPAGRLTRGSRVA